MNVNTGFLGDKLVKVRKPVFTFIRNQIEIDQSIFKLGVNHLATFSGVTGWLMSMLDASQLVLVRAIFVGFDKATNYSF